MLASHLYLLDIFYHERLFTSACARLRSAYPHPNHPSTHTCLSARFARCLGHSCVGAPAARIAPFSFYFLFLFLSPLQVSVRACGAPAPPPTFHSRPCYVSSLRSLPWTLLRRRACGAHLSFLLLFLFSLSLSHSFSLSLHFSFLIS